MSQLQSYMIDLHLPSAGKTLDAPMPSFSVLRVIAYERFERAQQSSTSTAEASPLVRWASEELKTASPQPVKVTLTKTP